MTLLFTGCQAKILSQETLFKEKDSHTGVRTKSWTFRAPKGAGNVFKRTTRKSLGIV